MKHITTTSIILFDIEMGYTPNKELHTHNNHEFFLTLDGKGEQLIEKRSLKMKKGDLFYFPAGHLHHGNGAPDGNCLGGVINLHEDLFFSNSERDSETQLLLKAMTKNAEQGQYKYVLSGSGKKQLIEIFKQMLIEGKEKRPGYRCMLNGLMNQFLVTILRHYKFNIDEKLLMPTPATIERIHDILRFLESNYNTSLSVNQAAQMCNMSRSYFQANFKNVTGKTFVDFVNDLKIINAERLFKEGNLSTAEIIQHCGFKSQSQFYKVLKEVTGKTPKELKKIASSS